MKTKLLIIALALPLVFGCEKSDVDDNGGKDNTEQGGNAGGYDPDKEDPMEELPPLEDVDDICTKMDDIAFMAYCYENFDVNNDGKVSMTEANSVSSIECNTASSFTGIGYFTNLTKFRSSSVRTLNLGYNKKLVSISCPDSPLEAIDLRYNTLVSAIYFQNCRKLTKVLFADEAPLESVDGNSFYGCSSLSTVSLPDNCKKIGKYAFRDIKTLSKIKFPKNLESIGPYAFSGCSNLTSLSFPESLSSIDVSAFSGCSNLTSAEISINIEMLKEGTFSDCVSLENLTFTKGSKLRYIEGPYDLPYYGNGVFKNCTSLKSIVFPDGLTSIGAYAFSGCSGLTSVTLPDGLISIGVNAFEKCPCKFYGKIASSDNLEVIIGDVLVCVSSLVSGSYIVPNCKSIGRGAFSACTDITSLTFPEGLSSIGRYAFMGCGSLTSLSFPIDLTSIDSYAFLGCSSLTSIEIPKNVEILEKCTFAYCTSLENLTFAKDSKLKTIVGSDPADWNYGYTGVFKNCTSLKSIVFPDGLTSIGAYAFSGCGNLTSLAFPDGLTSIGDFAFDDCSNLVDVKVLAVNPPNVQSQTFDRSLSAVLHVPSGSMAAYKSSYWRQFFNTIVEIK